MKKKPILRALLAASRDPKLVKGVSLIISKIRNWVLIKKFKMSPCTWECFCKSMIVPLMHFDYQTTTYIATQSHKVQSHKDWKGRPIVPFSLKAVPFELHKSENQKFLE